jgi:hypothetical protein
MRFSCLAATGGNYATGEQKKHEKNQSFQTRGVGIKVKAPVEKTGTKYFGEALAVSNSRQDC